MNTFVLSLLLTFTVQVATFAAPGPQPGKKDRPTQLARYQMGAYIAASGTKLRVNVDKELGGQVILQLIDLKGNIYYNQILNPADTIARLSLDLTNLTDGSYMLKLSNGLEMEVREIKISTQQPTTIGRSITVLQAATSVNEQRSSY